MIEAETEAGARVALKRKLRVSYAEIGAVDLQEICINSVIEVKEAP